MSGRIYFTDPAKCASIVDAGDSEDAQDEFDIICGEMVFDTDLANVGTGVQHECGQWRPSLVIPAVTNDTYDYSWHHPAAGYYGPYINAGTAGLEDEPTDPGGEPGGTPTPGGGSGDGGNPDGTPQLPPDQPSGVPGPGANATRQAQYGMAPPESPGNTQRLNILGRSAYNTLGTAIFSKPQGYSVIKVTTYLKVSDPLQAGDEIELNLKLAEWKNDRGPVFIAAAAIRLDSATVAPPNMIRVERRFTGYQKDRTRLITLFFERRNDLPTPDIEVWPVRHVYTFEP